jgi:hypothetical protein
MPWLPDPLPATMSSAAEKGIATPGHLWRVCRAELAGAPVGPCCRCQACRLSGEAVSDHGSVSKVGADGTVSAQ